MHGDVACGTLAPPPPATHVPVEGGANEVGRRSVGHESVLPRELHVLLRGQLGLQPRMPAAKV